VRELTDLDHKLAWPYLLSSLFIAWLIYVVGLRKGLVPAATSFWKFTFPREVYSHPSAKTDYKFVALDLSISFLVYMPLFSGLGYVAHKGLLYLCTDIFTVASLASTRETGVLVLFLAAFLIGDFGIFLAHYLMHRVPVLWQFHKVHHSAEVMTPITVLRVHPVDNLVLGIVTVILSAVVTSTYTLISEEAANHLTILGVNAVTFLFFFIGSQLRHSHIWLSYGPLLSFIFISPAQHQIHHSTDLKHWDTNYGYVLAIWDFVFRSLYVPRGRENLQFGLLDGESKEFSSVARLYFLPFAKATRELLPAQKSAR
jgi:sterol desaturase/sphingolipid hydroxylase (fatty acid hydroxylase superfamily)